MEKKLITFEQIKDLCGCHDNDKCYLFTEEIECNSSSCPSWEALESPEPKIIITAAGGK